MDRICKDAGHRNWLHKTGEECTCHKYVPASEYDALAAHVERLCRAWWAVFDAGDDGAGARLAMHKAVEDAPTTSLARLKAQWQAEVIDKWSAAIIQAFQMADAKHAADPNYPRTNLQMVREICCDMNEDADRMRRQAPRSPNEIKPRIPESESGVN